MEGKPVGVPLTVVVIDDPALAAAISRRRGDWNALSGDTLEIREASSQTLAETLSSPEAEFEADVLVYPTRWLGPLAEAEWIIPLRTGTLGGETYAAEEILPLVADVETVWGDETYAAPLGSPVFVLAYRADLFRALDLNPPETWDEYRQLAQRLHNRELLEDWRPADDSPWAGAVEPTAESWGGAVLLARAAAYADSPHYYATLFDSDTMFPRITSAAFVRALEAMQAVAELRQETERFAPLDPADAWGELLAGRTAMAVTWPIALENLAEVAATDERLEIGFAELPGAAEFYRDQFDRWDPRPEGRRHVTLLGAAGRMASATAASRNAPAALRLIAWLSGGDSSLPVGAASPATTLYRTSHLDRLAPWTDRTGVGPEAAPQYAAAVRDTLSRADALPLPRLPAGERYMAALDQAVLHALSGEASQAAALTEASNKWEEITSEMSESRQQRAYQRSLNLPPIATPQEL